MTLCISREGCEKNGLSIAEAILLFAIGTDSNLEKAEQLLVDKGLITAKYDTLFNKIGWRLSGTGSETLDAVFVDSEKTKNPEEKITALATQLKDIFPKGKKDGTNYYWADGVALIVRRLKLFYKKYGDTYTNEQIIEAAKKYVESFNGNYIYMKLLKYFIFKEKTNAAGEVEGESDLVSYIENAGQEDGLKNDWQTTLR